MTWFARRRRARGAWALGAVGVAAGAAAAVARDPARRTALGAEAGRALREVEEIVSTGSRDLGHRARGLLHDARAWLTPENPSDEVLAERVRARLGHLTSHARAIRITALGGHVRLAGPVLRAERMQVLRGARAVRGVRALEDALETHDGPDVAALEGSGPRPRPAALPPGSPAYRLVAGAAGVFLVARALVVRGLGRIPTGLFGLALLRTVAHDGDAARQDAARLARELRAVAVRAAAAEERRRRAGAPHERGGAEAGGVTAHPPVRRVLEVKKVRSPMELEPGVASASPDPLLPGRVDRKDLRARRPARPPPDADVEGEDAADERIATHASFNAPDAGAPVREADLGATLPHDEEERELSPDDVPWGPSPEELFPRRGTRGDVERPQDEDEPSGDGT
jgi:hypothetical protein